MKKANFILIFLFMVFASGLFAGGKSEIIQYETGVIRYKKTIITGQLLKIVSYFPNGQIQEIGHYKNGKRHGSFVNFNENGIKISSAFFYADKKDGLWAFYHSNGKVERYVFFNKNQIVRLEENGLAENSEF